MTEIRSIDVRANGVRLHCLAAGDGPLVLLLHGFPDFSWVWRRQLLPLARAGYRVVAPDLRGFGRSEKPRAVRAYDVDVVADDVSALARALGAHDTHDVAGVIGHDLGGVVTWRVASRQPRMSASFAVLNAPHPGAWARALLRSDQLFRSTYVGFFQLPVLPELALRAGGAAILLRALRRGIRAPGAFTAEDEARQRAALTEPGAITGGLNYYRAMGRRAFRGRTPTLPPAERPVLVLWGERDSFLSPRLADDPGASVGGTRVVRFPDAGHWVQLDEPEGVNRELIGWLRGG